jgi:hypothetical protein
LFLLFFQSGLLSGSQQQMTMATPAEVSNAGAALSGLDQQSALAAVTNAPREYYFFLF